MNIKCIKPSELKCRAPFSTLFPPQPKIVETIAASMREHGYDQAFPVVVWQQAGVVVEGNCRVAAAKQANVDVYYVDHQFPDEASALAFAIACQIKRRNLSDGDVVRCVTQLDKLKQAGRPSAEKLAQGCAKSRLGKSAAITAAMLGISARKIEQTRSVLDHAAPDVKAAVLAGKKTINSACREMFTAHKVTATSGAEDSPQSRQWICSLSLTVEADTEDAARHGAAVKINDMAVSAIEEILVCKCRAQRKELAPRATRPTSFPNSAAKPRSSTSLDEDTPFFLE
ncbi:MAG: hypothetical protein ACOYM3_34990 [Terrimicrobiaceae bacterium]